MTDLDRIETLARAAQADTRSPDAVEAALREAIDYMPVTNVSERARRDRWEAALAARSEGLDVERLARAGEAHALKIGGYGIHCACDYYFEGFGPNPRTQRSCVRDYGWADETLFEHIARAALSPEPEPKP